MDNEFTGDVELQIGGKPHIIKFDWVALSTLKSKFTEEDLDKIISGTDLTSLADLLIIGLNRYHPDMTANQLTDNPPALMPAIEAVEKALTFAYFGADGPPSEATPADEKPAANVQKKRKPTKTK